MLQKVYNKNTLFNDPIYGFIPIESDLILKLINHPFFQRLRRISQMGLSSLVYPGAHHTRFEHAIGAMHIMQKSIGVLKKKGVIISKDENESMQIAILLHDIGHGPFSHASERIFLEDIDHEELSLKIIKLLNIEFNGSLDLAIKIFTNSYPRKFMNQLISGQIDVDRLDYLKRDSFYTGVTEGNINTDRIIAMMNVEDEQLVFEYKGIHSIEKFLLARRLMYWQVYLHKTSLVAELLLVKILERFRHLIANKQELIDKKHFFYPFIELNSGQPISNAILSNYLLLEDSDLFNLLKSWRNHKDFILSNLSKQIIDRKLPKIIIQEKKFSKKEVNKISNKLNPYLFNNKNKNYFVFSGSISNQTYRTDHSQILIKKKKEQPIPLSKTIKYLDFNQFSKPISRYYLCYPKNHNSL